MATDAHVKINVDDRASRRLAETAFVLQLQEIHPSLGAWAREKIREDGRSVAELKQRLGEIIESAVR